MNGTGVNFEYFTYHVLAKGERHVVVVTANLDENIAEVFEPSSNFGLESFVISRLRKAIKLERLVLVEYLGRLGIMRLTWRQTHRRLGNTSPGGSRYQQVERRQPDPDQR